MRAKCSRIPKPRIVFWERLARWLGSLCSSLHPWSSFCFHGSTKDNAAAAAARCCWKRDYGFDLNISLIQFSVTGKGFSDVRDTGGSAERGLDSWCLNCSKFSLVPLFVIRNWVWPVINLSNIKHSRWSWKSLWCFICPDNAGRGWEESQTDSSWNPSGFRAVIELLCGSLVTSSAVCVLMLLVKCKYSIVQGWDVILRAWLEFPPRGGQGASMLLFCLNCLRIINYTSAVQEGKKGLFGAGWLQQ